MSRWLLGLIVLLGAAAGGCATGPQALATLFAADDSNKSDLASRSPPNASSRFGPPIELGMTNPGLGTAGSTTQ